jgi:hypothetical protein
MDKDASGNVPPAEAKMAGGRRTRKNRGGNMHGGAKMASGSKAQVWHGTARHTSGGLTKKDLMRHKGKIVSRRKHAAGLKAIRKLRKLGYVAKKGTFKLFKKQRGGNIPCEDWEAQGFASKADCKEAQ